MLSMSMGSPAGMPSRLTTSARPCDSPAVRNRTMRTLIAYEETAAFRARPRENPRYSRRTDSCTNGRRHAVMLLADRYLRCSGCWIDLATARAVLVAVRDAGARRSQVEWAERCAMLSLLRHPLLNPLIDFGV